VAAYAFNDSAVGAADVGSDMAFEVEFYLEGIVDGNGGWKEEYIPCSMRRIMGKRVLLNTK